MAIKGKSRSRGAKTVTRGPKPAYVPVRPPLLARRGLWIGVASVVGTLLVVALVLGFLVQRDQAREDARTERMAEVMTEYGRQLDPILAAVGEPEPPVGIRSFPELDAAIAQLEADSEDAPADLEGIATTARETVDAATSALEALEAIDEQGLLQGKDLTEEFVLYVINSKGNLLRSLRLWIQVGELTAQATEAEGSDRTALTERARAIADVAAELATRANSEYVEAQVKAGVFEAPDPFAGLPAPTGS